MGAFLGNFIKRSMHVSTRTDLPSELVPGYLYFVEDEGVLLLRMEGEVHTYAKQGPRGPQGPMGPQGPQGPAGPGYYSPPPAPLPNPPAPPSGEFPVGTALQFNALPYKIPDGGMWEVDVVCTLSSPVNNHFYSRLYNVRYKQTLPGGETLTLQRLIEGAEERHRGSHSKSFELPRAELIAGVDHVSVSFVETTWRIETDHGDKRDRERHIPIFSARPGKATRKS